MDKSQDTSANDIEAIFFAVDLPILINNLRLLAEKNQGKSLPITAKLMIEAADAIERLTMHSQGWRYEVDAQAAEIARLRSEAEHWKSQALSWMGRRTSGVTTGEGASQDGE